MSALLKHEYSDESWMAKALDLTQTAMFLPAPNPRVACLIVKNNECLASGVTQAVGDRHAEAQALYELSLKGLSAEGATVYVTLEPCSHFGRTPPCVDALINAGVSRVVIAMRDPNPKVDGISRLRAAGIDVKTGVLTEQALALNVGFISRMVNHKPWMWLKTASSLDGYTALPNGVSKWITGQEARTDGHYWRARSCAVLSGIGTVLADNPSLRVREYTTPRQPALIILDSQLQCPLDAQLLDFPENLTLLTSQKGLQKIYKHKALIDQGVSVVCLEGSVEQVNLAALPDYFLHKEFNEVHVEAGATLNGALYRAGLVDEWLCYIAPCVLGGGRGLMSFAPLKELPNHHEYHFFETQLCGQDVRMRARHHSRWQQLLAAVS